MPVSNKKKIIFVLAADTPIWYNTHVNEGNPKMKNWTDDYDVIDDVVDAIEEDEIMRANPRLDDDLLREIEKDFQFGY